MARSKDEIASILSDLNLRRDTYNLIKYSDEIVEIAKTKHGNILKDIFEFLIIILSYGIYTIALCKIFDK